MEHKTRSSSETPALPSEEHRTMTTRVNRLPAKEAAPLQEDGDDFPRRTQDGRCQMSQTQQASEPASVSTVIKAVTVKRSETSGRERRSKEKFKRKKKKKTVHSDRSLTFLLSFVLLGFFLLLGYRLRHFPVAWQKMSRSKLISGERQKRGL